MRLKNSPMDRFRNAAGDMEIVLPSSSQSPVIKLFPRYGEGFYVLIGYVHDSTFYLCDYEIEHSGKRRKVAKRACKLKDWYHDYLQRERQAKVWTAEWEQQ